MKRIAEFVPEAEGQNLAPSAAMTLLASHFEDYSKLLAAEWLDVHEDIVWFEEYCDEHDLIRGSESDDAYEQRVGAYFDTLDSEDETSVVLTVLGVPPSMATHCWPKVTTESMTSKRVESCFFINVEIGNFRGQK